MGLSFLSRSATKARIVRRNETSCLLVSFGASNPPLLWQYDLEKLSDHAMTLQEKNGEWDLGLSQPGGAFSPVAHFDERAPAEEAYARVSRALVCEAASSPRRGVGKKVLIAVGLILLALFVTDLFSTEPAQPRGEAVSSASNGQPSPQTQINPPARQEIQTGVPMNADDVLEPPAP